MTSTRDASGPRMSPPPPPPPPSQSSTGPDASSTSSFPPHLLRRPSPRFSAAITSAISDHPAGKGVVGDEAFCRHGRLVLNPVSASEHTREDWMSVIQAR